MASWREEYIQALSDRDEREKASYERISDDFIEAYTKLLDHTTALEAEKAARESTSEVASKDPATPATANDGNAQIRSDLAEALRSNGQLKTRIKTADAELVDLRAKSKTDTKRITDLTRERAILMQKVKDRDEELKEKARLLENIQDEMISLNLQLNMSEKNAEKLKRENKDLIDRWMDRKGKEADEMNKTLE